MTSKVRYRVGLASAFISAARCYWFSVFPCVRRELRYWRTRAAAIPDTRLRRLALESDQTKWSNVEGAAAFAIFSPPSHRQILVKALVAFQRAYDYADTLSEQPTDNPIANGRLVHQPLAIALSETSEHPDYYAHSPDGYDGGYLIELANTCGRAFDALPSHTMVRPGAVGAANRIITYQSLNHSGLAGHTMLAGWASQETPPRSGLRWWETGAACASSLTALALLSAAADPKLTIENVIALEMAYHPWASALHTLLDSLVDWREDEISHQPSLLDNYRSTEEVATRLHMLAHRSRRAMRALPQSGRHSIILSGMTGLYLASPEALAPRSQPVAVSVRDAMDEAIVPVLQVMRLRRLTKRGR